MTSVDQTQLPVESPPDIEIAKSTPPRLGLAFSEAAGLLTIWSLLVINEGAIRFNALTPYGNFSDTTAAGPTMNIALGWSFFASLFEMIFGFMGLFLGLAGFIFRFYNTNMTKLFMLLQAAMGWYVFAIYVFGIPAAKAANLVETPGAQLSVSTTRFLITLGIFTSFHFCLALQGGQFVFFARLVTAATGTDFLKQKSGLKMRAMFWNGNFALAGLWTLIAGSVIVDKLGGSRLPRDQPFAFPPHVGAVGGLTITTGIIMLLWGVYGIVIAGGKQPGLYYLLTFVVYLFVWLNFTVAQFGLLPVGNGGGVAMHSGLVFMVATIGPYFVYLAANEKDGLEE